MSAKKSFMMLVILYTQTIYNTFTLAQMYQIPKTGANNISLQMIFVKETRIKFVNVQMGHFLMAIFVRVAKMVKLTMLQLVYVRIFVIPIQILHVIQTLLTLLILIVETELSILMRFVILKFLIQELALMIVCLIALIKLTKLKIASVRIQQELLPQHAMMTLVEMGPFSKQMMKNVTILTL